MNQKNLESYLMEAAAQSSATFLEANVMTGDMYSATRTKSSDVVMLDACLAAVANEIRADVNKTVLSFGVGAGIKLSTIAKSMPTEDVYGFDHYNGLTENWTLGRKTGFGSRGGIAPTGLPGNVTLETGEFATTLPAWLTANPTKKLGLLHLNTSTYTPTKYILDTLQSGDRYVANTMIVIETFCNYPGWQNHSKKAVDEWIPTISAGLTVEYNRFSVLGGSIGMRVRTV